MQTQVTGKGLEIGDDLRSRVEGLALEVAKRKQGLRMAKFVVEERDLERAIGVVLAFEDGETVVRHGQAGDWDRALLELQRRLERAFEEPAS